MGLACLSVSLVWVPNLKAKTYTCRKTKIDVNILWGMKNQCSWCAIYQFKRLKVKIISRQKPHENDACILCMFTHSWPAQVLCADPTLTATRPKNGHTVRPSLLLSPKTLGWAAACMTCLLVYLSFLLYTTYDRCLHSLESRSSLLLPSSDTLHCEIDTYCIDVIVQMSLYWL